MESNPAPTLTCCHHFKTRVRVGVGGSERDQEQHLAWRQTFTKDLKLGFWTLFPKKALHVDASCSTLNCVLWLTHTSFQVLQIKEKQTCNYLRIAHLYGLPLEKAMAPHSSTLAWKIPWTEEPGRLQSMGLHRVGHDWATSLSLFTFMHWRRKWQPTPVFLPGESQGWWSLVGCRLWGRTESDTTEAT